MRGVPFAQRLAKQLELWSVVVAHFVVHKLFVQFYFLCHFVAKVSGRIHQSFLQNKKAQLSEESKNLKKNSEKLAFLFICNKISLSNK